MLFVVEIAGKPDEVLPVAQLVFHFGPPSAPAGGVEGSGQVVLLKDAP